MISFEQYTVGIQLESVVKFATKPRKLVPLIFQDSLGSLVKEQFIRVPLFVDVHGKSIPNLAYLRVNFLFSRRSSNLRDPFVLRVLIRSYTSNFPYLFLPPSLSISFSLSLSTSIFLFVRVTFFGSILKRNSEFSVESEANSLR